MESWFGVDRCQLMSTGMVFVCLCVCLQCLWFGQSRYGLSRYGSHRLHMFKCLTHREWYYYGFVRISVSLLGQALKFEAVPSVTTQLLLLTEGQDVELSASLTPCLPAHHHRRRPALMKLMLQGRSVRVRIIKSKEQRLKRNKRQKHRIASGGTFSEYRIPESVCIYFLHAYIPYSKRGGGGNRSH